MNTPSELKYTNDHEWVRVEGDVATIGITDYAQNELGDIIYIDITASPGDTLSKGDAVGSIEAVKTVSELFVPVNGELFEINAEINNDPSVVNSDPYSGGWIVKVKIKDAADLDGLLSDSQYKELIGQ